IKKWMLFNLGEINPDKFLTIMVTLNIMILRTSQNLKRLEFGGRGHVLKDQLSDALFAAIEKNKTLNFSYIIFLILSYNQFGYNDGEVLTNALKKYLRKITRNIIDDRGGIEFSHVLQVNNTLTFLDVSRSCIDPKGVESLSNASITNNNLELSLNLSKDSLDSEETLNPLINVLKNHSTLTALNLSTNQLRSKDRNLKSLEENNPHLCSKWQHGSIAKSMIKRVKATGGIMAHKYLENYRLQNYCNNILVILIRLCEKTELGDATFFENKTEHELKIAEIISKEYVDLVRLNISN
ncbi:22425_t:CDS:2, partial [Dentiscutata erythropus]